MPLEKKFPRNWNSLKPLVAKAMGKGRKPKPTALKILNGNPGHRPLPENEPRPRDVLPECPDFLDEDARAEWGRLCHEAAPGVITEDNRAALLTACMAYSDMVRADRHLKKEGYTVMTARGESKSPWVAIKKEAAALFKSLLVEFGFTPSSRSKINAPAKNDVQMDAEDYLDSRPTLPISREA